MCVVRLLNYEYVHSNKWSAWVKVYEKYKSVTQPCLCSPMDYSQPGSSVYEIFQARILEWFAISYSNISVEISLNNDCPDWDM